jgi:hypothetical protein
MNRNECEKLKKDNIYIYIEREREFGYIATRSTDDPYSTDRFLFLKFK